jgi:NAD(P)-dependent dehydrogenase (short-subunit alcohol dehydrogenase family)
VIAVARTQGGLEELDDAIRAIGGTATLVPVDLKDGEALDRLGEAIAARFGRLDVFIANAGVLGPISPLQDVAPADFDAVMAVNVTANHRLIRGLRGLLIAGDAGRAVFVTSGAAHKTLAYWGPYSVSKAALNALVRTFANETATTNLRVNLFNPGPIRTKMRAQAMPGEDPMTLDTAEQAASTILPLCLPSFPFTGQVYDYPTRAILSFQAPA